MKNLIIVFLAITLVFSALAMSSNKVYAEDNVVNTQNTASLEIQLHAMQKQLVVLLDKKVAMLQAELKITLSQRLRNLQFQLVGLLDKQVSILKAQLAVK